MPTRRRQSDRAQVASRRRAISMLEILVVFSVVLFMLATLLPGLGEAKERARRVMCADHQRQWGTALQYYRDENHDYLPREGVLKIEEGMKGIRNPASWFNALPPYLDLPTYMEMEGAGVDIHEIRDLHVWICPSKDLTDAFKSFSGKNQFHYGMNQVLDGVGSKPKGSKDTPGFPDAPDEPLQARRFLKKPTTVFMFDIADNLSAGTPRSVATMYQKDFMGKRMAKFHGDYANVLYLTGAVVSCRTDDLVTGHDFEHGAILWNNPRFYWGYTPP